MAGGRRSHGQGTFWGDLIGPNPTDRGKAGTKRSLLVDGEGGPLSIVVAGANVHDAKLLEATLDAIVVERPQPTEEEPQHLCLDKGYDNPSRPWGCRRTRLQGAHPTHRRGEAGRLRRQAVSGAPVGCGTDGGTDAESQDIDASLDEAPIGQLDELLSERHRLLGRYPGRGRRR